MNYWTGLLRDWGLAAVVVVSAFAVFQFALVQKPLSQGPAPMFSLPNPEGGMVDLASYGDQTVLLNFWFSDCGPCRSEIPDLVAWSSAHPDVPLIGVSTDQLDLAMLRTRAAHLKLNYPVAHDRSTQVSRDYRVTMFPTTVVVRGGEIRAVRTGTVNAAGLDALVAAAAD